MPYTCAGHAEYVRGEQWTTEAMNGTVTCSPGGDGELWTVFFGEGARGTCRMLARDLRTMSLLFGDKGRTAQASCITSRLNRRDQQQTLKRFFKSLERGEFWLVCFLSH
jgi:hypothetical protein